MLSDVTKIATRFVWVIIPLIFTGTLSDAQSQRSANALYKDSTQSTQRRVEDLLERMTLPEKISQLRHIHSEDYDARGHVSLSKLCAFTRGYSFGCVEAFPYSSTQYVSAVRFIQQEMREHTRLGIPVIAVMEGLHGTVQDGCTIYPQSIALASTFNPLLARRMARCIGLEMKAIGAAQVLAPDLDLARELRWGRVEETYGEDPFLVAKMGVAYVMGLRENGIICTPKHFIGHGSPSGGLNLAAVEGGRRELLSLYLQPFEKVISAGPLSLMNCYSSYDGEPVAGSAYFLTDLLRRQLKFKGYVYSDWGSVDMLDYFHHTADGPQDAAIEAIQAGLDLEAGSSDYAYLDSAVRTGALDKRYIDRATRNVLFAKFASGLFDAPLPDTSNVTGRIHTAPSVELSKEIAEESIVLLQNKGHLLPLSSGEIHSLAIIGPNADQIQFGDYSWSRSNKDGVTPLQGIRSLTGGDLTIHYAKGCDLYSADTSGFELARQQVQNSDAAVIFVGSQSAPLAREGPNSTSGEGYDLSDLRLPGSQEELVESLEEMGKPVIIVLVSGRPFAIPWIKANCPAIVVQWYGGEQEGTAIAEMLFGKVNPSGKLPVSFPQSVGELPCYYNYLPTDRGFYGQPGSPGKPGRDYVFASPGSLWPFGYGLSYTSFKYDHLQIGGSRLRLTDTLTVSTDITNTGEYAGKEVVQLYVRDMVSSVVTPVKQLKAFEKISLEKGETKTVKLRVPVSELYLYNSAYQRVVEPGNFECQVGSSSADIQLKGMITVLPEGTAARRKGWINRSDSSGSAQGGRTNMQRAPLQMVAGIVRDVQASVLTGVLISAGGKSVHTDNKGAFSIEAPGQGHIRFSLEGYETKDLPVPADGNMNVHLKRRL